MTITNQASRVTVIGNGAQTVFDYDFKIPAQGTANLWLLDSDGEQSLLAQNAWLLNNAGNPNGGTFQYPYPAGAPLAADESLVLERVVPYTQGTAFNNQSGVYPSAVEGALDTLAMQIQQLSARLDQSLHFPITDPEVDPTTPSKEVRAGRVAGFNTDGEMVALDLVVDISDIAAIAAEIVIVAGIADEVVTVAGIAGDVTVVAADSVNINAVAADLAAIDTVSGNIVEIAAVGVNIADVIAVAGDLAAINAVNANEANINLVAADIAEVAAVGGSIVNVNLVAGDLTEISAVAGNLPAINTVAAANAAITTNAANIASIITNANNIADINLIASGTTVGLDLLAAADAAAARTVIGALGDPGSNGMMARTALATTVGRTIMAPAAGITISNGDGVAGNPTLALANDLLALENMSSTGIATRTAANAWTCRTLTAPAAGFTITNPAGLAGNPTFVLANDLAAVEGLAANGIATRTATDTWAVRTITGTANRITVANGDGVAGNPTLDISSSYVGQASITTLGTITTGVWNGTAIPVANGGTGATGATAARANLAAEPVATASAIEGQIGGFTTAIGAGFNLPGAGSTTWMYVASSYNSSGALAGTNVSLATGGSTIAAATPGFYWSGWYKRMT